MDIRFLMLIAGGYLLGSVPAAYLVARWRRGVDIRKYGSGNVGASNVMAVVSKRWSIPVTLFDVGKGALVVWIAQLMGLGAGQQAVAGLVTIVGHNWPVFLNFKGGRGIFTSLGVIMILDPRIGLFALVFPYLFFAPFKQLALGVLIALISLPLLGIMLGNPVPTTLGFLAIMILAIIRRIVEPRTPVSATVPTGELIINRLLFDRDIRSRDAWLHQTRLASENVETLTESE